MHRVICFALYANVNHVIVKLYFSPPAFDGLWPITCIHVIADESAVPTELYPVPASRTRQGVIRVAIDNARPYILFKGVKPFSRGKAGYGQRVCTCIIRSL